MPSRNSSALIKESFVLMTRYRLSSTATVTMWNKVRTLAENIIRYIIRKKNNRFIHEKHFRERLVKFRGYKKTSTKLHETVTKKNFRERLVKFRGYKKSSTKLHFHERLVKFRGCFILRKIFVRNSVDCYGLNPEPPCNVIVSPVTYEASSDARNTQTLPMSCIGSAKRPNGMPCIVLAKSSG